MDDRPRTGTVWARSVIALRDHLRARGVPESALPRPLQVTSQWVSDPDTRIPISVYYDAVEAAVDAVDDPYFGIGYIEAVKTSTIDAVGFLAMASATVGEALRGILRYFRWMTDAESFELEVVEDRAVFRVETWGPPRPAHAHVVEMYAADCLILPVRVTGQSLEVTSFYVRHAAKGEPEEYRRRFGRVPSFGAPVNEWSFPASVLERPMPNPDPGLQRFLERYLDQRAPVAAADSTITATRRLVEQRLAQGDLSLAGIAAELSMSVRTLQRRLAAESSSLEAIVEDARKQRSVTYLDLGLSIAEVSFMLGYSDPSAFHRAFRRWTGRTPRQFQAQTS